MVSTKLTYFLLPLIFSLELAECTKCQEAAFKAADIDVSKMDGEYTVIGIVFLTSSDDTTANDGPSNVVTNTNTSCDLNYAFKPDGDDIVKMNYDNDPTPILIKFDNPKVGRGIYAYTEGVDTSTLTPLTILKFSATNIIMSICLTFDGIQTGVSWILILVRSDTPVDASTSQNEIDELVKEFGIKDYYALNSCPEGRKDGNTGGSKK